MISLTANQLYKRFQDQWIIKNFSHSFQAGSITGISGRNGSGKTTLIRILAGFMISSKGRLDYSANGTAIKDDELYKYLSYSAPYLQFDEELTAAESFGFLSKLKSFSNISTDEFLKMAYLDKEVEKSIKNYSSGMKQRLGLAFSLLSESPLLIFDEPTSYLDQYAKDWFHELLSNNCLNRTIIIASNEPADFKICQEIIEL